MCIATSEIRCGCRGSIWRSLFSPFTNHYGRSLVQQVDLDMILGEMGTVGVSFDWSIFTNECVSHYCCCCCCCCCCYKESSCIIFQGAIWS